MLSSLEPKKFGLEPIKEMYLHDIEFLEIYVVYEKASQRLCVPKCSIRDLLVNEAHEDDLMVAFWGAKDLRNIA